MSVSPDGQLRCGNRCLQDYSSLPTTTANEKRGIHVRLHDRIPRLLTYRTLVIPLPPNVSADTLFGTKLSSVRLSIQRERTTTRMGMGSELKIIRKGIVSLSLSTYACKISTHLNRSDRPRRIEEGNRRGSLFVKIKIEVWLSPRSGYPRTYLLSESRSGKAVNYNEQERS